MQDRLAKRGIFSVSFGKERPKTEKKEKTEQKGVDMTKEERAELDFLENLLKKQKEEEQKGVLSREEGMRPLAEVFPKIVLASQSPRRVELIQLLGITPEVYPSHANEERKEEGPQLLTQRLAFQKAEEVRKHFDENTLILAADTVVFDGKTILGKPKGEEDAFRMLSSLSGRKHEVYTGVCLLYGEKKMGFCEKTTVQLLRLSEQEIREYIASGDPMDKAGAYGIQGIFARFVKGIEGDYYNVMGLPVSRLYQSLKLFCKEIGRN